MKKNILFVINPIAGGRSKDRIHNMIDKELDHAVFDHEYAYSESVDHARKLSRSATYLGFDIVAAVGGDGTVNEVARGITSLAPEHKAVMAIVPFGSGNGLARYLNIPMNAGRSLRLINTLHTRRIDTGLMNGRLFVNVAGMGFDAHISHEFAKGKKRGLGGYAQATLKELSAYRPERYQIAANGHTQETEAFILSIANATQYGNNAYVAPLADASDGKLDICILKPFPLFRFPGVILRSLNGSIHHSPYLETFPERQIIIQRPSEGPVHLDGEPMIMGKELKIEVQPSSLEVMVP